MFPGPIIELHISNLQSASRCPTTHVFNAATAVIAGLGAKGYVAAVRAMGELIK